MQKTLKNNIKKKKGLIIYNHRPNQSDNFKINTFFFIFHITLKIKIKKYIYSSSDSDIV